MAPTNRSIRSPFFQEVESVCFQKHGPAARLQRERILFPATKKAFNMSASYATSFGSGAGEHVQNWWDQCRVMVANRQPEILAIDSATLAEIAGQHGMMPDAKAYVTRDKGIVIGVLLDCTDKTGQQLLFLKNYAAQMTLDNLILGESTKRQDKALAGLHTAYCVSAMLSESTFPRLCNM